MAKRRSFKSARAHINKRNAKSASAKSANGGLRGRIALLYGLTGLFGVVVSGLIIARPRPLQAQASAISPDVVLMATESRGVDPLDAALQTSGSVAQRNWTGVTVLSLTTTQARAAQAHFKVVLQNAVGDRPQVVVGSEWLKQSALPGDPNGQFVLVVVVDDHEREVKSEATVVALVDRLCQRLKIKPDHVKWS